MWRPPVYSRIFFSQMLSPVMEYIFVYMGLVPKSCSSARRRGIGFFPLALAADCFGCFCSYRSSFRMRTRTFFFFSFLRSRFGVHVLSSYCLTARSSMSIRNSEWSLGCVLSESVDARSASVIVSRCLPSRTSRSTFSSRTASFCFALKFARYHRCQESALSGVRYESSELLRSESGMLSSLTTLVSDGVKLSVPRSTPLSTQIATLRLRRAT